MIFKKSFNLILSCAVLIVLFMGLNIRASADSNIDSNQYYINATQVKVVNGNYLYTSSDFKNDKKASYINPGTYLNVIGIVNGGGNRGVFRVNYNGRDYYFSAYKFYTTVVATVNQNNNVVTGVDNNLYHTSSSQIKVTNGNYLYTSINFSNSYRADYISPGTYLSVIDTVYAGNGRCVFKIKYNGKIFYFSAYKYYSVVTAGIGQNKTTSIPKQISSSQKVLQAWKSINYNGANKVSLALYDKKTNTTVLYTPKGSSVDYYNASIVKVSLLANFLTNHNINNNSNYAYQAKLMITQSDNTAATYLYKLGGGAYGLQNFYRSMGMNNTFVNYNNYWGLTKTSASDQLKLLNSIYYQQNILTPSKLSVITSLTAQVNPSQRWGVGNVIGANVQVKNGWLPLGNDGYSNAVINSLGHIKNDKVDYTLAILSNGNYNQGTGIRLANQIGLASYNALNN